jgi:hypothetical protein
MSRTEEPSSAPPTVGTRAHGDPHATSGASLSSVDGASLGARYHRGGQLRAAVRPAAMDVALSWTGTRR